MPDLSGIFSHSPAGGPPRASRSGHAPIPDGSHNLRCPRLSIRVRAFIPGIEGRGRVGENAGNHPGLTYLGIPSPRGAQPIEGELRERVFRDGSGIVWGGGERGRMESEGGGRRAAALACSQGRTTVMLAVVVLLPKSVASAVIVCAPRLHIAVFQ